MYEEKPKKKLNINWKSLIIKMGILLVALFILLLLLSLINKGNKKVKESNLATNLDAMKVAATDYFKGSKLPLNINGKKKISLQEMFDSKLLVEFKDQYDNSCDTKNSYAEATKVNSSDYTIKVKLVCGKESDYIINTVTYEDESINKNPVEPNTNNNTENNNPTPTDNKKPSTSTNKKPSTSTNKKPSVTTNKKPSNNSKPNTNTNVVATTCTYGNKEYTSNFPLAYAIPGNCAVSKSDYYNSKYANAVSSIVALEYRKLNSEMVSLSNKTGATLSLGTPNYYGVYNKTGNGLVGYQVLFTMYQKVNYALKTVYQYYLDQNGNRVVVIDKRNNISTSTNTSTNNKPSTNPSVVPVKSVTIKGSSVDLYVGDTYELSTTISPSNATNKTVRFKSSNTSVARVSSTGKITALKYGKATITATADGVSDTIRVYVDKGEVYKYCNTNTERVYATNYIDVDTVRSNDSYKRTVTVKLNTKHTDFYDVEYGNIISSDEYLKAYNYWNDKKRPLFLQNGVKENNIETKSYSDFRKASLRNYNFKPSVSYIARLDDYLYFDIHYRLKNLDNIKYAKPFYTTNKYGIYYLPLYFDVITIDRDDCRHITEDEVNEYKNEGYVKVN